MGPIGVILTPINAVISPSYLVKRPTFYVSNISGFAPEKSWFLFCWKASCDWKMCFVRWGDLFPFMFSSNRRWLNQRSSMFTPRKSEGRFKTLLLMFICLDFFDLFCWCVFTIYSCKSLSIKIWENVLGTFSEHVEQI